MQRGAAPLCTFIEYKLIQISAFLILDKSIAECLFFRSPQIPEIRSKLPPKERTREEAVACPLMKEGTQRLTKPNGGASHRPGAFDCSKWDRLLMYKIIWPCAENTGPYNFRKYLRLGDKMKVKFSTNYIFAKHSTCPAVLKSTKQQLICRISRGSYQPVLFLESQSVLFGGAAW